MKYFYSLLLVLVCYTAYPQAQTTLPPGTILCNTSTTATQAPSASTGCLVTPTGAPTAITLAQQAAQQGVLVDAFKSTGDADDTQSFVRADAAHVPMLLGCRTYSVSAFGGVVGNTQFVMKGVRGCTTIQRNVAGSAGSIFFTSASPTIYIDGVTFDMNSGSIAGGQWGVLFNTGGQNIDIEHSVFKNDNGGLGIGVGISSTGTSGGGWFLLNDNEITNNTYNAVYLASVVNGSVTNNYIHDNAGAPINVGISGTGSATNLSKDILISGNIIARNTTAMGVGGVNSPYTLTGNLASQNVIVANNSFVDDGASSYMLSVEGGNTNVIGNQFTQTSTGSAVVQAIDCLANQTLFSGNVFNLPNGGGGIDCGGSLNTHVIGNKFTITSGSAVNIGGNQNSIVKANEMNLSSTATGVSAYSVEGGSGTNSFAYVSSNITVENNQINMNGTGTVGVVFLDNACGFPSGAILCPIRNNDFTGVNSASSSNAVKYYGSATSLAINGNTWNGNSANYVDPNGSGFVITDDVFDEADGYSSTANAVSIYTTSMSQNTGTIVYAYPTAGGSGYVGSTTTFTLGGCTGGTGFAATAQVNSGVILGVRITNHGSGYTGGGACTLTATDTSGGTGATFSVTNKPVMTAFRKFRYRTNGNTIQSGGGVVALAGINGYLPTGPSQIVDLESDTSGTYWYVVNYSGSKAVPTVSSGGGTGAAIGTYLGVTSFRVTIGTGGTASSVVINLAGSGNGAAFGWNCNVADVTTPANQTRETATSSTTVTFTNYNAAGTATAWTAGDTLQVGGCQAN